MSPWLPNHWLIPLEQPFCLPHNSNQISGPPSWLGNLQLSHPSPLITAANPTNGSPSHHLKNLMTALLTLQQQFDKFLQVMQQVLTNFCRSCSRSSRNNNSKFSKCILHCKARFTTFWHSSHNIFSPAAQFFSSQSYLSHWCNIFMCGTLPIFSTVLCIPTTLGHHWHHCICCTHFCSTTIWTQTLWPHPPLPKPYDWTNHLYQLTYNHALLVWQHDTMIPTDRIYCNFPNDPIQIVQLVVVLSGTNALLMLMTTLLYWQASLASLSCPTSPPMHSGQARPTLACPGLCHTNSLLTTTHHEWHLLHNELLLHMILTSSSVPPL